MAMHEGHARRNIWCSKLGNGTAVFRGSMLCMQDQPPTGAQTQRNVKTHPWGGGGGAAFSTRFRGADCGRLNISVPLVVVTSFRGLRPPSKTSGSPSPPEHSLRCVRTPARSGTHQIRRVACVVPPPPQVASRWGGVTPWDAVRAEEQDSAGRHQGREHRQRSATPAQQTTSGLPSSRHAVSTELNSNEWASSLAQYVLAS
jgi:hypothetical protein